MRIVLVYVYTYDTAFHLSSRDEKKRERVKAKRNTFVKHIVRDHFYVFPRRNEQVKEGPETHHARRKRGKNTQPREIED